MRKICFLPIIALALAAPLAGCATTSTPSSTAATAKLDADRAFFAAQLTFKSLQQAALVAIGSGALTGSVKDQVIALNDEGVAAEAKGYAAIKAADALSEGDAAASLTLIVQQLAALGVKPASSTGN